MNKEQIIAFLQYKMLDESNVENLVSEIVNEQEGYLEGWNGALQHCINIISSRPEDQLDILGESAQELNK